VNEEPKQDLTGFGTVQKLTRLLAAPVIEASQRAARIQTVEKDIVLPLRVLLVAILGYYFFFSGWLNTPGAVNAPDLTLNSAAALKGAAKLPPDKHGATALKGAVVVEKPDAEQRFFLFLVQNATALKGAFVAYAILTLAAGAIFLWGKHLSLAKIQWMVFALGVVDAVMMGTLTLVCGGFDTYLYWVFFALILHNALAIPVAFPQLLLNFFVSMAFMAGGILDRRFIPDLDTRVENPWERMIVLVAWALCCYGIQVLFEKQKRAEAEATELAVRQERLRTAGRLAAEIAHQIKNPLGIITNAAFCLHRATREGQTAVDEQIQIIREEVERADQIITELMGYAQLAEGKVERLEVAEELDAALLEVFPPALKYPVKIHKDYAPALPALLMQRRHLSGVLVNLLQNAREAMDGRGDIHVLAQYGEQDSVRIQIADTGPGIPPDKIDKIFEAYFTTRDKGTGLGLAIVKHNTEMYGGTVRVQSELGKGTRFALEFPARILMRFSK
jgi:signal transduction histidine kinase